MAASGEQGESDTATLRVFCSYAHVDARYRELLEKHLSALSRDSSIALWSDRRIAPGEDWQGAIDGRLDSSEVILCLVSADYLASSYCIDVEMMRALERHRKGLARVVPVIVRPVDWENTVLSELQALPSNGKAISSWDDLDEALRDVALGIRGLLAELRSPAAGDDPGRGAGELSASSGEREAATATASRAVEVELIIDRDFESYGAAEQSRLLSAIKELLSTADVRITRRKRGSVRLGIRLPEDAAERLRQAVAAGLLDEHGVVGLESVGGARVQPEDVFHELGTGVLEALGERPAPVGDCAEEEDALREPVVSVGMMRHHEPHELTRPLGVELAHGYGWHVHILNNLHLLSLLARLSSAEVRQPEKLDILRAVFRGLITAAAGAEFPAIQSSPEGHDPDRGGDVHREWVLDPDVQVVIVDVLPAGIVPAQVCFETLSPVFREGRVRLDHVSVTRRVDDEGRVVGVDFSGSKIGGPVDGAYLLLPEPLGATGAVAIRTLQHYLTNLGEPARIITLPMIATPEYMKRVTDAFQDIRVYTARLDRGLSPPEVLASPPGMRWDEERGLDERGNVVPGAGGLGEVLRNAWC